jgi:hypothetical protein
MPMKLHEILIETGLIVAATLKFWLAKRLRRHLTREMPALGSTNVTVPSPTTSTKKSLTLSYRL